MSRFIQIVEVGARDGLQNEKAILDPLDRVALIRRLEACGVSRQEVVSFVNPARVPQMAGAETIMAALPSEAGRSRIGLVLNERGWDRCVAAGCDEALPPRAAPPRSRRRQRPCGRARRAAASGTARAAAWPGAAARGRRHRHAS